MQDKLFKVLLILSAIVIPVIGGGIIYSLTVDASGAFEEFGFWHFIFSDDWVKKVMALFLLLRVHCLLRHWRC